MTRALLLACLLASAASSASAGSLFESLARQAAERAVRSAAARAGAPTGPAQGLGTPRAQQTSEPAAAPPQTRTFSLVNDAAPGRRDDPAPRVQAASAGPAPWPSNESSADVKYPSDLEFPAEVEAESKAFDQFGRYECDDCEGGHSYDSWVQQALNLRGYNAWENKVGAMALGQKLTWKGNVADGVMEVVGETPVHGFKCKQVRYTLTRRKGSAAASRGGLFCFGKSGPFAAEPSWVEVQ